MNAHAPKILNHQIYREASDWLIDFRSNDVDADGRKAFYDWLCASPDHVRAYLELAAIWDAGDSLDRERVLDDAALLAAVQSEPNLVALEVTHAASSRSVQQRIESTQLPLHGEGGWWRRKKYLLGASSMAGIIALAWFGYAWHFLGVYSTDVGEVRRITLVDGSVVELDAQSKIRVRYHDEQRDVDLLNGQAFFQVAHDSARPFVVHTDSAKVRAVGTEFDVYRKTGGTTVTVVEGTVAILPAELAASPDSPAAGDTDRYSDTDHTVRPSAGLGRRAVFLSAGEQAIVTAKAATKQKPADVSAAMAWTQGGRLVFHGTPLQEVATEFNRYNKRRLVIADPEFATFKITGIFLSTDPSSLIRFLQLRPDIEVTQTPDEFRITRKVLRARSGISDGV